eukprot:gene22769-28931_t
MAVTQRLNSECPAEHGANAATKHISTKRTIKSSECQANRSHIASHAATHTAHIGSLKSAPSVQPSRRPVPSPSISPSLAPITDSPSTLSPSVKPTALPTLMPTRFPVVRPTTSPSEMPTIAMVIANEPGVYVRNATHKFNVFVVNSTGSVTVASGSLALFLLYKAVEWWLEQRKYALNRLKVVDWDAAVTRTNPTYVSFENSFNSLQSDSSGSDTDSDDEEEDTEGNDISFDSQDSVCESDDGNAAQGL